MTIQKKVVVGTKAKPHSKPVSVKTKAAKLKAEIKDLLIESKTAIEDADIVRCKEELREKRAELGKLWDDYAIDGELP